MEDLLPTVEQILEQENTADNNDNMVKKYGIVCQDQCKTSIV